ncbi:cell surface glycoprotein CD200 receptor 5-like [Peromyscus californicus insignis]|uniref:cell surface glycoprotein CD200 receptor 5-like n=1 Tax=Peromyscus californicus insignis TaxID=564181 RepID=UPI0022A714DF|nr:cell surface glycoprotein CD200 receptor 5-like [Peromyscus californicus insignis]
MNAFGRTSALGLLISITILVPDSSCSIKGQHQEQWFYPVPEPWDDEYEGPRFSQGQPPCIISFKVETKETNETNCVDRRITWASTPDQSPDLQINAVALDHDGHYSCQITTSDGNFYARWYLQVLGKSRTVVCEATAGKPAAQISWTPEGYCKTMNESHSNGTVTVRSTCQWDQSNVSAVFCAVTHSNGSKILSIELNQGVTSPLHSLLTILYVKLSLLGIILLIIGFSFFQKRNYFSIPVPDVSMFARSPVTAGSHAAEPGGEPGLRSIFYQAQVLVGEERVETWGTVKKTEREDVWEALLIKRAKPSGEQWSVVKMRFTTILKGILSTIQHPKVPRQPQNLLGRSEVIVKPFNGHEHFYRPD